MKRRMERVKSVSERTALGVSTVWEKSRKGTFPKPHKVSSRVTVWDSDEVDKWIEEQLS